MGSEAVSSFPSRVDWVREQIRQAQCNPQVSIASSTIPIIGDIRNSIFSSMGRVSLPSLSQSWLTLIGVLMLESKFEYGTLALVIDRIEIAHPLEFSNPWAIELNWVPELTSRLSIKLNAQLSLQDRSTAR